MKSQEKMKKGIKKISLKKYIDKLLIRIIVKRFDIDEIIDRKNITDFYNECKTSLIKEINKEEVTADNSTFIIGCNGTDVNVYFVTLDSKDKAIKSHKNISVIDILKYAIFLILIDSK